jgi:hypothetical protein
MKKVNGNLNVDTDEMSAMRQAVVEQELSARSWKAYYEKMYFSLESEKLEEPYKELQDRRNKRLADEKAKMDEFLKNLNEQMEKGVDISDSVTDAVENNPMYETLEPINDETNG